MLVLFMHVLKKNSRFELGNFLPRSSRDEVGADQDAPKESIGELLHVPRGNQLRFHERGQRFRHLALLRARCHELR